LPKKKKGKLEELAGLPEGSRVEQLPTRIYEAKPDPYVLPTVTVRPKPQGSMPKIGQEEIQGMLDPTTEMRALQQRRMGVLEGIRKQRGARKHTPTPADALSPAQEIPRDEFLRLNRGREQDRPTADVVRAPDGSWMERRAVMRDAVSRGDIRTYDRLLEEKQRNERAPLDDIFDFVRD